VNHENEISQKVIGASIEVHKTLGGPGLLESVYEEALCFELETLGLSAQRQVYLPIQYKDKKLGTPLRIDLLVEKRVIVEVKSTAEINPIFKAQLLTYLRLSDLQLGLLINFGNSTLKEGITRIINSAPSAPLR
jgi:GxxExxY protein